MTWWNFVRRWFLFDRRKGALITDSEVLRRAAEIVDANEDGSLYHPLPVMPKDLRWLADRLESPEDAA